jgi:hypothetical protein
MLENFKHTPASLARYIGCFDETEFARLAKVEIGTLASWRKRGKGPAYTRLGNTYLYPFKEVEAYVQASLKVPHSFSCELV